MPHRVSLIPRMSVIRCNGLVKRYGDVVAIDGIDLDVREGECFGLLGPNGAGKTTTVEVLQGLLKPDAGTVTLFDLTWSRDERALRERIGTQLQETKLPDKLSVAETVRLFRSFYRRGTTVERVLAMVKLEEKRDAWVRELSGGQRQRLAVACALVSEPDLLFLDEPTTGLDPQARLKLWEIIREFQAGGGTALLTTHYMEEAEQLCDRVAIVDQGRIIALDSPAQLIRTLRAEQVVEFALADGADLPDERLLHLPGVESVARDNGSIRLTVSHVHETVPGLMGVLKERGAVLGELSTHRATLEDVFIALTGRHLRDG